LRFALVYYDNLNYHVIVNKEQGSIITYSKTQSIICASRG